MSFEYDYFDFERLPNHDGMYRCHILQVCKETYSTVHGAVNEQVYRKLSNEPSYVRDIVLDDWEKVHNVKTLKRFIKEYNHYFDYRVVFKNVLVNEWDGTRRYCMLRPLG